ncbi:putative translation elongation factor G [Clostridiales bacterium oral taxon 876 str. F0540]|nr:putative translation elongation factor G [Clostridiales bacterium oral taxon 876 str. F0540]
MGEGLNVKNIGILAHVDAGKTTVTEQMLYKSGTIRSLGSVDKGTAHTDSMEIERQRGISVKSAYANLLWKNININIIDTPGHIDFSAEVERSLSVLDGAVLVISAVEGVQPQTEVYFKALQAMRVPTVIFINKIDRTGADTNRVIKDINKSLTKDTVVLENIIGEKSSSPEVEYIIDRSVLEQIADKDEDLLDKYINEEEVTESCLRGKLIEFIKKCRIYPVLYGSAIKAVGIEELLNTLTDLLPVPSSNEIEDLSALVFKIEHIKNLGKAAYIRLYSGEIKSRDSVYNSAKNVEEKITQIKKLKGLKEIEAGEVKAGEIALVSGLSSCSIGDILGRSDNVPKVPSIATPLLTIQVLPKIKNEYTKLLEALEELQEEDPLLYVQRIREKEELHIQIMGMVQLEILQSILKSRFNLEVSFGKPSVIYKETPSKAGYGFAAYTMPKPCWAIVRFYIEPLKPGSGIVYESQVRAEDIKLRYQNEVERQLPITLQQGLYGWNVVDLKITLIEGEDHVMHSNPGDFLIATAMGIMDGLQSIGTTLLEPILKFRITVPEEAGGKVLGDIINMRGSFDSPVITNGNFTVEGEMPAATSLDYPVRLGIISGGKGIISSKLSVYKPIALELGEVRERQGVNPLDRAKFILAMRNALG